MSADDDEHWLRYERRLGRYREALDHLVSVLAGGAPENPALRAALEREPDPSTTAPAVDPYRINLGMLERALEGFWREYYALPLPPSCEASRFTYRFLPAPLSQQHRAALDQCIRVLLSLFGWRGTADHPRLQGLVWGYTHRLPGIEDLVDRYCDMAWAELQARDQPRK